MAHYAQIEDGIVVNVIVSEQDFIDTLEGTWLQTSYNTYGGAHYDSETGLPDDGTTLRKNYASTGFTYDAEKDAFISPQPFSSWSLDEGTCLWIPPIAYPEDGNVYTWEEESQGWLQIYAADAADDNPDS
jgi:hypothetical protein